MTLGLYVHDYERAPRTIRSPSVGYLENDLFGPNDWKPMYPVPAFENLTRRDAFWGAKIVTSFTDAQIEAAVSTGAFSEAKAAAYLVEFLKTRRDRIGNYWFSRVNALDRFTVSDPSTLAFTDMAVDRKYAEAQQTYYLFEVLSPKGVSLKAGRLNDPYLSLDPGWEKHDHIVISLLPQRPNSKAKACLVYLKSAPDGWQLLGLNRMD